MQYVVIIMAIIILILALLLLFTMRSVYIARKQMEEIANHPDRNRQLKNYTVNKNVELLLKNINDLYSERQQERITYQKRETQIRSEIENISHDLRTPLTSILGYIDLIKDHQTTEEERLEYLDIIGKRARVLQGFIEDFYELSRIEADDYPMLLASIHVQPVLGEVVVSYYHEFLKRNIKVDIQFGDNQCNIVADRICFNRILNNLVQNALKYAYTSFSVKQYIVDKECIIEFVNDRENMKEEDIKFIFDRFYTGDFTRNRNSTGLGLTISKLLVEKLKGHIEAYIQEDLFVIKLILKKV